MADLRFVPDEDPRYQNVLQIINNFGYVIAHMHHAPCMQACQNLFILEMNVANLPGKVVGEITGHQGPVRVVRLNGQTYMHVCLGQAAINS